MTRARETVTVITVTRRRPALLARAIESVQSQCCDHVAEHLVVVDACAETWLSLGRTLPRDVWPRMVQRAGVEATGPARLAHLRDWGLRVTRSPWVAFHDDDNQWDHDHLHGLLATAQRTQAKAVHSWLRVVDSDGSPYLEERFPWAKDEEDEVDQYRRLVSLGVVDRSSNVYRDRADRFAGPDTVRSVDAGEWLLDRDLARRVGFTRAFNETDRTERVADDDKFLKALLLTGENISSTCLPTLVYQLGGFSNGKLLAEEDQWH